MWHLPQLACGKDSLNGMAPASPSPGNWRQVAPLGLGEEDPEENGGLRGGRGSATSMDRPGSAQAVPLMGTHMCSTWAGPATRPPESGSLCSEELGSGWLVSAQFSVVTTLFSEQGLSSSLSREAFAGASSGAWELQAPCA